MDGTEGLGEEDPIPPLLPPEDRLWRHPSEVAAHAGAAAGAGPGRGRRRRRDRVQAPRRPESRLVPLAVLAGAIGALGATGAITAAGGLGRVQTVRTVVQREVPAGAASVTAGRGIIDIAEAVRPTVVLLQTDGDRNAFGAGVVYRSDGHILTSARAVGSRRVLMVKIASGPSQRATVVGVDADTDVAILKVEGTSFTPAPLGSASGLKAGHLAMAVGSTVSVGVIAATGRSIDVDGVSLLDMIQTDTPLPDGFGGSPLVDGTGAVVGICTQVRANAYATPIDVARSMADQLIDRGGIEHAWLGIEGEDLGIAASDDLKLTGAALVTKVKAGGPAANAGMVAGDVITAIDGAPLTSINALKIALRSRSPGQIVGLTVWRDGRTMQVRATLAPRPTS